MFSLIPDKFKIIAMEFLVVILFTASAGIYGYVKGSAAAEAELQKYRANAEKQISDLKSKNIELSNNIQVKYVDRVNTIHDMQVVYRDKLVNLGPGNNVSNGWVEIHDASAKLRAPDMNLANDKSSSGISDNAALSTIVGNYSTCHETREQLSSLQQWIRDNKAAIDAANKKSEKKR